MQPFLSTITGGGRPSGGADRPSGGISRRRLAGLGAGLAGAAGLLSAACGTSKAPETPAASQAPAEIEYIHGFGDALAGPIAETFTQRFPHITVRLLNTPWAEIPGKLTTGVAAGSPPDVVMAANSDGRLYSYAHNGLIQPLEKLAGANELQKVKEWIHPSMWDLGTYTGKIYGVPMWTQSFALVWNKNHFREAGLNPDRPPQTLDEIATFAEKLTKKDSAAGYSRLGYLHEGLNQWIPVFGGRLMDASGKKVMADDPNNVRALEWLLSWQRKYDPAALKEFRANTPGNFRSAFAAEKYSMVTENPIITRQIKLLPAPFEYGVTFMPAPTDQPGTGCYTYGDIPAVCSGAPHGAQAWQYVRFLSGFGTEDGGVDKYLVQPQTPVSETAFKAGAYKPVEEMYPGFDMYARALFEAKRFLFPPKIPTAAGYGAILGKYVGEARNGIITPKEALSRATQEAQAELDQAGGAR